MSYPHLYLSHSTPLPPLVLPAVQQPQYVARVELEAALKVYASLGANDEDIRQRVIKTDVLMNTIVTSLSAASPPVQLAAVRCLHSLSRSVHTLRTTFQVRS